MPTYYPAFRVLLEVLLEDFTGGMAGELVSYSAFPKSLTIENNHHRAADTCEIALDYRDFPIDPRAVRSIRVFAFLGDLETPDEPMPTIRRFMRFAGFVDEPESSLGGAGEVVRLRCRDYTSIFLDREWPGRAIPIDRPFAEVILDVLSEVPGVALATPGKSGGVRLEALDPGVLRANLSTVVGRPKYAVREGDDAWTVLSDLCGLLGVLPVFDLDVLAIRSAGDFRRTDAVMLYGRNVETLTYRRKFHEARTAQVLVRSWDETTRQRREAVWPVDPIVVKRKIGTDGKATTETAPLIPYYVTGPYTADQLREIARGLYEEYARQEVEGDLTTMDLTDLHQRSDLTTLRNGDRLFVRLGRRQEDRIASIFAASPNRDEAIRELTTGAERMSPEVAELVLAASASAENLATVFYVKSAKHSIDRDRGYNLSVRFTNYLGKGAMK